jgi:hypothetical protein
MRLSELHQQKVLSERQYHFSSTKYTDKQSPWRGSIGDNKSFGGISKKHLGRKS